MTDTLTAARPNRAASARSALAQRLQAVAAVLLGDADIDQAGDPEEQTERLLTQLITAVHRHPEVAEVWLLYAAIASCLPDSDEVLDTVRGLQLMDLDDASIWLLNRCLATAIEFGEPEREVRIVCDGVVVDVTHSAHSVLHTGIQQVVRNTVPRWARGHEVVPVAWSEESGAMRLLSDAEQTRVLRWGRHTDPDDDDRALLDELPLVIPWRSVVVLPEVPAMEACRRLAALGEHSTNRLVVVGHDCIPVVSADLMLIEEPIRFVKFLTVIKHSSRLAAVSASAGAEFAGFASALPTQGLVGPVVSVCRLPLERLRGPELPEAPPEGPRQAVDDEPELPLVLCVGSHEPRKNHLAVLFAAETLWREGLAFELLLIGGSGFGDRLADRADRLKELDRPVRIVRRASDAELSAAYRRARFTVFPSLHEGYGLPVAESMAYDTPVITANFGSMAEQVRYGGALAVDTREDRAITDAMRTLLTDDRTLARLRAELAAVPSRSWDDYAGELWQMLIEPELAELARPAATGSTAGSAEAIAATPASAGAA